MASNPDQKAVISEAATRYGIDPKVLWGLYGTETSFGKNTSTSSAGAVGPFQFEPATARGMGVNPYDFKSAAFGAARYLSQYKSRGLGGMLSAYNAGPAGGYQSGYVNTTLANAKSFGSLPSTKAAAVGQVNLPGTPSRTETTETPNPQAKGLELLAQQSSGPLRGVLEAKAKEGTTTSRTIPGIPSTPAQAPTLKGPGKLGGFLGASAPLEVKRVDEGQDIQTRPGEALLAPGDGQVVAVKVDPSGFGPDYPVVRFNSGPMAGQSVYLGHTDSALKQGQSFKAGETIAHTSKTGHNAPPGWAEIGLGNTLGQGNKGQGQGIRRYLGT